MADLPETLTITVTIPPGNVSAGSTVKAISTIGFGVPGKIGPPPAIVNGAIATGAPGSSAALTLTLIAAGTYQLDGSIPAGAPGVGTGNVNYDGATPAEGRFVVAGSTTNKIKDGGPFTAATIPNVANGNIAATTVQAALNELDAEKLATSAVDTDATLAANSSTRVPAQSAIKSYVDNAVTGNKWKPSVRAATTVNGALATAFANGQAIDGVTLATGDRILLKNQTAGAENGLYTVNASGAPTRALDADTATEIKQASVFVEEGTAKADTGWVLTNNGTITPGTTALVFAQFSGAGTYSASGGLQLLGNQFSIADVILNAFRGVPAAAGKLAYFTSATTMALVDLMVKAVGSDIRAGTDDAKFATAKALSDAAAYITLTDASTVAWDMATGYNAKVTIAGNRIFGAPTNPKEGWTYTLRVIQDPTGSRVPTWNACFDWGSTGAPTLSTGANKDDLVTLICVDASAPKFRAFYNKAA